MGCLYTVMLPYSGRLSLHLEKFGATGAGPGRGLAWRPISGSLAFVKGPLLCVCLSLCLHTLMITIPGG